MKAVLLNQSHEYQREEKLFQDKIEAFRQKVAMLEKDSSEQEIRSREVQLAFEEERAMFEKQINLLQEDLNSHDKNRSPKQKVNILLLGQTERTKQLVANTILDREEFGPNLEETKEASAEVDDRIISIVNMPMINMLDLDASRKSFADAILLHPEGYHAIVLVFSLTQRPSFVELNALTAFGTVFGKDVYKYIIFIFTHDVRAESVKIFLSSIKGSMGEYIDKADQRYLIFNVNWNTHRKKELTGHLHKLIDNMVQKQNGKLYSNYMFEQAKVYVNTNAAIQVPHVSLMHYHNWFKNTKNMDCVSHHLL
ncbi:immune-associated nucleotide-binding protein 7-like [Haliotis rubra]|uniref:immune-associated nucleotide-binding protein 7-like n=1 Tax=Haliotis rubra TaxID=36100 RepID=UPI001EE51C35|nr:immune-associated nucleotide-binding protein 7-like [Haliotis rubra]